MVYLTYMDMGTFIGAMTAIQNAEKKKSRQTGSVQHSENQAKYPKEHSLILWLIFGGIVAYIPAIYYTFSKKHKWHL